jgi:hypothetical protein
VRYGIHNVRGVIGTGSPGHGAGRRAWMTDSDARRKGITSGRKGKKEVASEKLEPLIVLAHAIHYRLHDALARVHNPAFALTRIIPRRDPLHSFF